MNKIDQTALRVNQIMIVLLVSVGFLLNNPWLVLLTATFTFIGTTFGFPGFIFIYKYLALPMRIARPDVIEDDPAAHRFAQFIATTFLITSAFVFFLGLQTLAWVLALIVVVLALVNLLTGFCLGCFVYFQLNRLTGNK